MTDTLEGFPLSIDNEDVTNINISAEVKANADASKEKAKTVEDAYFMQVDNPNIPVVGKKWDAFSKTWDDTWAGKLIDYAKYDNGYLGETEDSVFKEQWSHEVVMETLDANNLTIKDYQKIAVAKNEEHKKSLVKWAIKEKNRNKFIDENLNAYGGMMTERAVSGMITGFADVDIAVGGVTSIGSRLTGLRKSMAAGATMAHGSMGAVIYNTQHGEISAGEAALFSVMGMGFDGFVAYKYGKPKVKPNTNAGDNILEAADDTPDNAELINAETKNKTAWEEWEDTPKREGIPDTDGYSGKTLTAYETKAVTADNPAGIWEYDPNKGYIDQSLEAKAARKGRSLEEYELPADAKPQIDATYEEINAHLTPIEGSGSYTQYNINETNKAKANLKSGKITRAQYDKRFADMAYGKYQHMGATTRGIAKETGKSVEWLRSPNGQEFAQKYLVKQNIAAMKKQGIPVNPANYYVYHQLGAGRAKRYFSGKLTNKDIQVMYDNLGSKARKRSAGNRNSIIEEWKTAYHKKGTAPTALQGKKRLTTDLDNLQQRRKQADEIKDPVVRRKILDNIDAEIASVNKKIGKAIEKVEVDSFAKKVNTRTQKDYRAMANDFKNNIHEYKQMIKQALKSGDTKTIDDLTNVVDELYNEGFISKQDYNNFKQNLTKGEFNPPELKVTQNKNGSFNIKGKKTKVAVSALAMVGLSAEAMAGDDGATFGTLGVLGIIAGAIALGMGAKNFGKMKGNMSDMFRKISNFDRTRTGRVKLEDRMELLQTSLTETLAPLTKDIDKGFTDFVKQVLWDFENGVNLTVERAKAALFHGYSGRMHRNNGASFNEWLQEQGSSKFQSMMSNLSFNEMSMRNRFEVMVFENIEQGKHLDSPAVVKAGEDTKALLKEFRQEMVDSGMKGADKMFDSDNYMPRYFRSNEMNIFYRSLDDANKKSFIDQISPMFMGKDGNMVKANAKAKVYFEMMIKQGDNTNQRFTNVGEIQKFLDEQGIKNIDAEEMASDLGIASSQSGRTKVRIDINKNVFETVTVKDVDGNVVKLELNNIFVNNTIEAMDRFLNSQSGHIAFADAGFSTIDEALEMAKKGSPENAKVMEDVINSIVGSPILDIANPAVKILETIGNITTAAKMGFSIISLVQEAFTTLVKSEGGIWKEMARESANIFKKAGRSSAIMEELMEFQGQGMHKYSASYGTFSHIAEGVDNMSTGRSSGAMGAINKASEIARDTVLYNLGLVPVSDFLSRINLVDTASYLHDVVHGTKTMKPQLMKAIGLTDELIEQLKPRLNKVDGELQAMGIKNWSREDQLAFKKLIDNMMQKRIQQVTLGGTPAWGRSTTYGVISTQLMKFPLQAFTNHGIYDAKGALFHQDPRAFAAMAAWFTGGYVSSIIRSEVKGQEVDDETHLQRAIESMPLTGAFYAMGKTLTGGQPAMLSSMEGISDSMIGAYSSTMGGNE